MKNAIQNIIDAMTALEIKILDSNMHAHNKRWHIDTVHEMQDSLIRLADELEEDQLPKTFDSYLPKGQDPDWVKEANNDF